MKTVFDWLGFLLLGLPAAGARIIYRFLRGGWLLGDLLFDSWFTDQ